MNIKTKTVHIDAGVGFPDGTWALNLTLEGSGGESHIDALEEVIAKLGAEPRGGRTRRILERHAEEEARQADIRLAERNAATIEDSPR